MRLLFVLQAFPSAIAEGSAVAEPRLRESDEGGADLPYAASSTSRIASSLYYSLRQAKICVLTNRLTRPYNPVTPAQILCTSDIRQSGGRKDRTYILLLIITDLENHQRSGLQAGLG